MLAKVFLSFFAAVGLTATVIMTWLWLSARPVLDEARAQYEALPPAVQCSGALRPPHYPGGAREFESEASAERSIYATACSGVDMRGECAYLAGAPRWLGFRLYRGAYLSSCETRALSLHGRTHLGRAMTDLYPDRDAATLTDSEQTCLVARTRYGQNARPMFCERNPQCCAAVALDADEAGRSP